MLSRAVGHHAMHVAAVLGYQDRPYVLSMVLAGPAGGRRMSKLRLIALLISLSSVQRGIPLVSFKPSLRVVGVCPSSGRGEPYLTRSPPFDDEGM